ncbi:MAG: hypothetical protein J7L04_07760 [Bacteroidales bacterium]|nr:hypothetical protein [Bacteroidales bacterium]
MKLRKTIILAAYLITIGLSGIYLVSCRNQSMEGMIVFTKVPIDNFNTLEDEIIHNYPGAQIVAINPDKLEKPEIVLTGDFYSACSPKISYDASHMLFTAQQNENDSWQIWEMNLEKLTSKKISNFNESCFGPAYLPAGRLVFSRQMPETGTGPVHALYTMNLDGSNISQITFQPHFDYTATVLQEGRILMLSKQLYPEPGEMMYMAMRPNGTKAELFYKANSTLNSQVYETTEGFVYFIEWEDGNSNSGDIISIHQNRPLFTKTNLTSGINGGFYSVLPIQTQEMIVSYRPSDKATVGLYHFSTKDRSLGESIYNPTEYHILEPVLVKAYNRPRDLPDDVDPKESTALLFCQDINVRGQQNDTNLTDLVKASSVEVLGINKSLGIVPVEEDGSFYLKVIADTPIRLQTLDENGKILYGPSDWLWLRPFERRGCVGCHEDPELVPKNFVPLSVKKPPVSVPVEGFQESKQSSKAKIAE